MGVPFPTGGSSATGQHTTGAQSGDPPYHWEWSPWRLDWPRWPACTCACGYAAISDGTLRQSW